MSLTDYLEEALPFTAAVFIALHGFLSSSISSFFTFLRCDQGQAEWISVVSRADQFVS